MPRPRATRTASSCGLVERGLCLQQATDKGNLLVFPSYYRRERPDIVQHPAVLVNYRFTGFLDEVYATLVVRLHHTEPFQQNQLWRYAADFKTNTGKQLGVKLSRRARACANWRCISNRRSGWRRRSSLALLDGPGVPGAVGDPDP